MSRSWQRQSVLIGSLGLTALLAGGLAGWLAASHRSGEQLQDAEFLRRQLQTVAPEGDKPARPAPPALVRVSVARQSTFQPAKRIIGRLVEVRKVTVASEVTGKIVEMPVEEGSPVFDGQTLLAQVDVFWSKLAVDRSKAQVASIESKLEFERPELTRFEELRGKNAVSQSEVEAKRATVAELEAELAEAEAALYEAQERYTRCHIFAPFDGTVVAKHTEQGAHVSEGTPIVDVVSAGEVDARLMVPESVVNLVHVGETLPVRVDPLGEEFPGKVVSIVPFGPSASRTFPVRIRLDDRDGRLKVGMSVTAIIATGPQREALVVSKDAVLVRPDGSTVWVAVEGGGGETAGVEPVPVTVTSKLEDVYAVVPETDAGRKLLVSGAAVVIEGAERLMPGQQVRMVTLEGGAADVAGDSGPPPPDRPAAVSPAGSPAPAKASPPASRQET